MASGSKRDKRLERLAAKAKKAEEKKVRLIEEPSDSQKTPRYLSKSLEAEGLPRLPLPVSRVIGVRNGKQPHAEFVNLPMTWCASKSDVEGRWTWDEPRAWTDWEWESNVSPSLDQMRNGTWKDILYVQKAKARDGKVVPKHHAQEVSSLVKEARDRWLFLQLDEFEEAFRFRFGSTVRAWGIRVGGHFFLVWWERHHRIYPVG